MKKFVMLILSLVAMALVGCAHGGKCGGKKKHGHHGHHKSGDMFKKADTNGDGFIDKKEYAASHPDMFAKMDTNKDGKISKEEAMAHGKGKHGHHMKKKEGCCGS